MVLTQRESKFSYCMTTDDGRLLAAIAIVPDGRRRAWLMGFPGRDLESALPLRPIIRRYRALLDAGAYDELRAWVASDDRRAIQFAESFGLAYDCGPATGFSPSGRDMNLYLWRHK